MTFTRFGKTLSAGLLLASVMIAPGFAQDGNPAAPATPSTPGTGQIDQGGGPVTPSPTVPGTGQVDQGGGSTDTTNPPTSTNGQSPESSSETDKPSGMIADEDVFSFDTTMGAANLTPEQLLAAQNTCRDNVTINPSRYSSNVRSFCDTLK